jgi:hypothetical protein
MMNKKQKNEFESPTLLSVIWSCHPEEYSYAS